MNDLFQNEPSQPSNCSLQQLVERLPAEQAQRIKIPGLMAPVQGASLYGHKVSAGFPSPAYVYIRTNPNKEEAPQHNQGITIGLHQATSDTRELVGAALACLHRIYREGYPYQKAGVALSDISPAGIHQGDLFSDAATPHHSSSLMPVLDKINRKMGKGTIKLASDGIDPGWKMKTGNKSPAYTTRWDELPIVR